MKKRAVIVGAGVNGLCLAFALQNYGWTVEVIEKRRFDDRTSASWLDIQLFRPIYDAPKGLAIRANKAFNAWKMIFHALGKNYFIPRGVIAISRKEGDWTDKSVRVMRDIHQVFTMINPEQLQLIMPSFLLADARYGVMSSVGGYFHAGELVEDLRNYLIEKGVEFRYECPVQSVHENVILLENGERIKGDRLFVTAGHERIEDMNLPAFSLFQSFWLDCTLTNQQSGVWRYVPAWVDLGGDALNLWGVPYNKGMNLRIGAGSLTMDLSENQECDLEARREKMMNFYAEKIADFYSYEISPLQSAQYTGLKNGDFLVKENGQAIAIMADSGHGFKFAAVNAFELIAGIENEKLGFAMREVVGAY